MLQRRHTVLVTFAVTAVLVLGGPSALAEGGAARDKAGSCLDAATTLAMTMCLSNALSATDHQLNTVYRRLQAKVGRARRPGLASVERRWIAFKASDCAFAADRYRGGTLAPVVRLDCLLTQTKRRLVDLRGLDAAYDG